MGQFVNRPGIDKAQIVKDGKVFPVVMTVPLSDSGEVLGAGPVPGFDIPSHDTVVMVEDSEDFIISVEYRKDNQSVLMLNFDYDYHSTVMPLKTTTVSKG